MKPAPQTWQLLRRSTPWAAQKEEDASTSSVVQVLMVSESNVCRSVLAEIIMRQQLMECGLGDMVQVESKVGQLFCISHEPKDAWLPSKS